MHLIIGLGNPGEEYKNTKHNIGREIVEKFAKKQKFASFTFDKKSNALTTQEKIDKQKVMLANPETFMNKSGLAVSAITKYFKIKPENIFVVHDDVDIPIGKMKISFGKNSAGHKGVEHITKYLKTKEYWRLRIGIGALRKKKQAMDIVLKKFTPKEILAIKKITKKATEALLHAIIETPQKAMTKYNQ